MQSTRTGRIYEVTTEVAECDLDGEGEGLVDVGDEAVEGGRGEAPGDGDVGAEDAGLEALDVAAPTFACR